LRQKKPVNFDDYIAEEETPVKKEYGKSKLFVTSVDSNAKSLQESRRNMPQKNAQGGISRG
jgi:hypothetical protein